MTSDGNTTWDSPPHKFSKPVFMSASNVDAGGSVGFSIPAVESIGLLILAVPGVSISSVIGCSISSVIGFMISAVPGFSISSVVGFSISAVPGFSISSVIGFGGS